MSSPGAYSKTIVKDQVIYQNESLVQHPVETSPSNCRSYRLNLQVLPNDTKILKTI